MSRRSFWLGEASLEFTRDCSGAVCDRSVLPLLCGLDILPALQNRLLGKRLGHLPCSINPCGSSDRGRLTGNPEIMLALARCCDRFRFADDSGLSWHEGSRLYFCEAVSANVVPSPA